MKVTELNTSADVGYEVSVRLSEGCSEWDTRTTSHYEMCRNNGSMILGGGLIKGEVRCGCGEGDHCHDGHKVFLKVEEKRGEQISLVNNHNALLGSHEACKSDPTCKIVEFKYEESKANNPERIVKSSRAWDQPQLRQRSGEGNSQEELDDISIPQSPIVIHADNVSFHGGQHAGDNRSHSGPHAEGAANQSFGQFTGRDVIGQQAAGGAVLKLDNPPQVRYPAGCPECPWKRLQHIKQQW